MDDEILRKNSIEVKNILASYDNMLSDLRSRIKNQKLMLAGEQLFDNREVCEILHIKPRTLQDYRDKGLIAFIKLEGKILYKQSDIEKVLTDNYNPAWQH